jgi:hypothetical protein
MFFYPKAQLEFALAWNDLVTTAMSASMAVAAAHSRFVRAAADISSANAGSPNGNESRYSAEPRATRAYPLPWWLTAFSGSQGAYANEGMPWPSYFGGAVQPAPREPEPASLATLWLMPWAFQIAMLDAMKCGGSKAQVGVRYLH